MTSITAGTRGLFSPSSIILQNCLKFQKQFAILLINGSNSFSLALVHRLDLEWHPTSPTNKALFRPYSSVIRLTVWQIRLGVISWQSPHLTTHLPFSNHLPVSWENKFIFMRDLVRICFKSGNSIIGKCKGGLSFLGQIKITRCFNTSIYILYCRRDQSACFTITLRTKQCW